MQAGERIDFEKLRTPVAIAAAVHASGVAAPQAVPRLQRDLRRLRRQPHRRRSGIARAPASCSRTSSRGLRHPRVKMTSITPSTRARDPVPTMPTVSSRPGRNVSTSAGWRYLLEESPARRCERRRIRDVRRRRDADARSAGDRLHEERIRQADALATSDRPRRRRSRASECRGSRTTCLVMPLCSVSANTSPSENV